jgi:hypothetical protein
VLRLKEEIELTKVEEQFLIHPPISFSDEFSNSRCVCEGSDAACCFQGSSPAETDDVYGWQFTLHRAAAAAGIGCRSAFSSINAIITS